MVVRHAAMLAFGKNGRGMIASDVIELVPRSLMEVEEKEV
jgi:NAD(P)H-hydrate repair Nnr-like enzyme with NAD(P)H-hydrate dehydratase domain